MAEPDRARAPRRRPGQGPGHRPALSLRVRGPARLPAAPRSVQEDPRRPDVPLQLRAAGRDRGRTLAIAIADPSQLMMIDEISLLLSKRILHQGRHAGADHRDPQEDRAVAARAGRSHRRLRARRGPRGRGRGRRQHFHRPADRAEATSARSSGWSTPRSSPPGAARQRHSHRDSRRLR